MRVLLLAGLASLSAASGASAAPVLYTGEDVVATTSSPHPNSAAAAASYDAAAPGSLVTFESAPVGNFGNLNVAPGVTLSGTDYQGNNQAIRNSSSSPSVPTLDGYNTTPNGTHFVELVGGVVTFSFLTPIQAFGAYISGVQGNFFQDTITFSDGTSQTINVPATDTSSSSGALDFVGFTDFGSAISSITIKAGDPGPNRQTGEDDIGVDDVRFQAVLTPVPEPASLCLVGMGVAGLLFQRRRNKKAA